MKILIIAENHTRNKYYQSSIESLCDILSKSGHEVRVATLSNTSTGEDLNPLLSKDSSILKYDDFIPDAILLNNDLSTGIPEILNNISQPILPDKNLGWSNRSKTIHFEYYSDVVNNFSRMLEIDSWLLEPLFRNCGEIDFKTKQGEDCLTHHASRLFELIKEKYLEKPL